MEMSCGQRYASCEACLRADAALASGTASPGSCSINSKDGSVSCSFSSDCLSLSCTEIDIGDDCVDGVDTLVDLEIPGSDADSGEPLCCASSPDLSGLCHLIREDLQKQDEIQYKIAEVARLCSTARHLPSSHRPLIVGWMRDVSRALRLQVSTLFLAASCLDRFVATAEALPPDGMLQLLALACISAAVKYNEVGQVVPAVWLGLAVDTFGRKLYTAQQLQRMEFSLLQTLGWRLHVPTTHTFLQHFLLCMPQARGFDAACTGPAEASGQAAGLAQVLASLTLDCGLLRAWPVASSAVALAEMSLVSEAFLAFDYSTIALSCLALAERLVGPAPKHCAPSSGPSAAGFVAAATGEGLQRLAPGLDTCEQELHRCCHQLARGGAAPA